MAGHCTAGYYAQSFLLRPYRIRIRRSLREHLSGAKEVGPGGASRGVVLRTEESAFVCLLISARGGRPPFRHPLALRASSE